MRKRYPWLVVIAMLVFTAVVFNRLPEQLPTHWDARGVVNGWTSRMFGAWLMPAIATLMAILLPWLPAIDPKRANYEKFRPSYDLVINSVVTMIGVLHVAMLGVALGWPVSMERLTPLMVGAMLIVLGNVMPRARSNWLFGIRTPWTLSNERVWEKTHRLGGFLFVAAGIVMLLAAFLPPKIVMPIMIASVVTAAVVPLVYSYFVWKQETSR